MKYTTKYTTIKYTIKYIINLGNMLFVLTIDNMELCL